MKQIKLQFRELLESYTKGLKPVPCTSFSPLCLLNYIPTRENQTMCVECLKHHGIFNSHPLLPVVPVDECETKIKISVEFF